MEQNRSLQLPFKIILNSTQGKAVQKVRNKIENQIPVIASLITDTLEPDVQVCVQVWNSRLF